MCSDPSIHGVDPDMPIKNVTTMAELRDRFLETPRVTAWLLTIFAALAFAVTVSGISGVIALSVSQRIEEFGVRMALGASRPRVLGLVVGQGIRLVVLGLIAGLAGSFIVTRVLGAYLFATRPTDPLTLVLVSLSVVLTGAASCAGPAWRAATADPLRALRAD